MVSWPNILQRFFFGKIRPIFNTEKGLWKSEFWDVREGCSFGQSDDDNIYYIVGLIYSEKRLIAKICHFELLMYVKKYSKHDNFKIEFTLHYTRQITALTFFAILIFTEIVYQNK